MISLDSSSLTAALAVLSLAFGAGCAEDLKLDNEAGSTETVATEPLADGTFMTRVDASDPDVWIYFSFVSGGQVIPLDPLTRLGSRLSALPHHLQRRRERQRRCGDRGAHRTEL
jgi:hypothetical protein